jgi:hypothetical protein
MPRWVESGWVFFRSARAVARVFIARATALIMGMGLNAQWSEEASNRKTYGSLATSKLKLFLFTLIQRRERSLADLAVDLIIEYQVNERTN